ncbi:alpha/beta fold hydrolase [Candidatus Woesearchaeota archaeon]|nr:alpha/beta fold hydrolase [Candidatus Woesearchaeota archaeon]
MTAIIFIHGLTATNTIFESLERRLSEEGYECINPMLPGHGTSPQDIGLYTHKDYVRFVQRLYDRAVRRHRKVIFIAESYGTNLALDLRIREGRTALVACGAVIYPRMYWLIKTILWLTRVLKRRIDYPKTAKHRTKNNHAYPIIPHEAIVMFYEENRRLRERIRTYPDPSIFIFSTWDTLVRLGPSLRFLRRAKKRAVEISTVMSFVHAFVDLEEKRQAINDTVVGFVKRHA